MKLANLYGVEKEDPDLHDYVDAIRRMKRAMAAPTTTNRERGQLRYDLQRWERVVVILSTSQGVRRAHQRNEGTPHA